MAGKLKLLGKNPRLALLFKAVIFGALFLWLRTSPELGYFSWFLFFFIPIFMYLRPLYNGILFGRSFIGLMVTSVLSFYVYSRASGIDAITQAINYFLFWHPFLSAILFYLILGLKDYVLVHRRFWHFLVFSVIFYQFLLFYFLLEKSGGVFMVALPVIGGFILLSEILKVETKLESKVIYAISALFALLLLEGIKAVKLLPFGFLSSMNLIALGGLFFTESALHFYSRTLNWRAFLPRVVLFIIFTAMIFLTSKWSL